MKPREGEELAVTMSREELRELVLDSMIEAAKAAEWTGFVSLDYDQVAQRMGVCNSTVRRWVRKEGLPVIYLGGNLYRVLEVDLLRWLSARRVGGRTLKVVK